jgi:hypothetical protein
VKDYCAVLTDSSMSTKSFKKGIQALEVPDKKTSALLPVCLWLSVSPDRKGLCNMNVLYLRVRSLFIYFQKCKTS